MKAKRENVVNAHRADLGEILPLDVPFSLFIDVCNVCNFKCKFCAIQTTETETFKKQKMTWELYTKIVSDIAEFSRPLKMLRLSGNGEPLINERLPQMIAYAKERGIAEYIEIVSNASLLTPKLSDELIEAGLDRIRISVEAIDAAGYERMCGRKIDWNEFVTNINYLFTHRKQCEIYIKTVDAAVKTEAEKELFYKEFEEICDKISIEHVVPVWAGYEKIYKDFDIVKEEGVHGHAVKQVNICPFPFYSFIINPDGEVTPCCMDWKRGISIGNVQNESVRDIWKGEKYRDFLRKMIERGRVSAHKVCAECEYPMYDAVDDLDMYTDELLKKFGGER